MKEEITTLLTFIFSIVTCVLISIAITFIDNCTLFEIAVNFYYALYFGIFFLIIGVFILSKSYRNYVTKFQHTDFIQIEPKDLFRFKYIFILGCLILLSSLFTLLLHIDYIHKLNYQYKIPFFCVIGISITFAIVVTSIDLINLCFALFYGKKMVNPLINSYKQIMPLIYLSCLMGFIFGGIFAIFDVEDAKLSNISDILGKEEGFLIPIAVVFGFIAGLFISLVGKEDEEGDKIIVEKGFKPISQQEEV